MDKDIYLDGNMDIVFDSYGNMRSTSDENVLNRQYLNILINIEQGFLKNYPELGIALWKSINGDESALIYKVIEQCSITNIPLKNVYIDGLSEELKIILEIK